MKIHKGKKKRQGVRDHEGLKSAVRVRAEGGDGRGSSVVSRGWVCGR